LDYARSLDNLAGLYMRQGEFSHAEVLNLEARKIFTDLLGAATPTAAINTSNLAYLYFKWGKLRQADQYAQLALAAEREILSLVASSQDESRQIESYRDARRSLDFYLTVSHALGRRTEETYRQVYAWKGTVFARQSLLRKVRQRPELRAQAAKLQEVSDRLAAILFSQPDPVHPELWKDQLDELAKERARRERELNQAIEPRAAPAASTDQLAAMLPAGIALVDLLEYMQSPAGPGKGGAAQLHLLAFVLRRDRQIVQVDLGASAPIAAAVDAWRTACVDRREFGVEEGQRLRQLVWLPLAKQLDAATTILIAPDGRLSQLPFAAIAGEKVGTQLIDDVAVAIVPVPQMLPELLRRAATPAADDKPSLLLVGDLNYSAPPKSGRSQRPPRPTYRALPGSKVEIEVVDKLFRDRFPTITTKILHEHEATESAVCNSMAASRFVHLATHGFFQPPGVQLSLNASGALGRGLTLESSAELPWRDMAESVVLPPGAMSGLVLSGANQSPIDKESSRNEGAGILTAFEVSELNLASTELVALSACQTALGEMAGGEGVLGLQRAFHIAGVPTVIASLWKVDDDATQPLMAEFYRRLWDAKQPLAKLESLREAQRYVRDHYRLESQRLVLATGSGLATGKSSETAPPFFWAAFVLSGDWR
jgi:CHAT domain-containing protein